MATHYDLIFDWKQISRHHCTRDPQLPILDCHVILIYSFLLSWDNLTRRAETRVYSQRIAISSFSKNPNSTLTLLHVPYSTYAYLGSRVDICFLDSGELLDISVFHRLVFCRDLWRALCALTCISAAIHFAPTSLHSQTRR